ncbi:MAG: hypothetical protein IIB95_03615 [Candidatus Marinimicrobia bacterium]|nr:hypothetical protein [Candidatus Neomarinimicrobiota bacterium]
MTKYFLICLVIFSQLSGQNYTITIFGFPFVSVTMDKIPGELTFQTQTTGLLNYFWPMDNTYFISYDSLDYSFKQFEKKIHQGSVMYSLNAKYDQEKGQLFYDDIALNRPPEIQTIFSMLVRVQEQHKEDLDTKWFPMEHDGQLFESRYLWAETDTILINRVEKICDHYRLDIKAVEDVTSLPEQSDYFMNNIIAEKAIRQIWVEKSSPRRIVQASVKLYGINIIARWTHD